MSIDLEWSKLDSSLSSYLIEVLNRQLTNAERPSFIGPIEVSSLDLGSTSPDVELVDLRDIYRDFLEDDDDDEDRGPVKVTEGAEDDEGFEWVSRRANAGREEGPYHHLPPHMRYGPYGSTSMYAAPPPLATPGDIWNAGMSLPTLPERPPYSPWPTGPFYRSPSPATPFYAPSMNEFEPEIPMRAPQRSSHDNTSLDSPHPPADSPHPPQNPHPNLQVHLHVNWQSDLRITLTTSLLINYPSPMFMSLPIKLSVIGLLFNGELAVAYEGERRRIHICILDDLDPYGPAAAADRPKRDSVASSGTPPELDDDSSPASPATGSAPTRPSKPLPIGQRLLPNIYIESEIGQADKHVLKNVTRVERFIQDVIRKTVEEELVFPNFHTLVMGEQ